MLPNNFDRIKQSIKRGRKRDVSGGIQVLHPGLSVDDAMSILDMAKGNSNDKSFGKNITLYNEMPENAATPRETHIGVWHCNNAADSSDNGNTLSLTDVSYVTEKKFGTHSMSFNGSTSKAACTLSSNEPITFYLFASAWGYEGSGKIFDWPDIFEMEDDGSNLIVTIAGEALTGPSTSGLSGWNYYAAQFNSGTVYIQVNDIILKTPASETMLEPEDYDIELGNSYDSYLDEFILDANITIQDDIPVYPQIGFPIDIVRYKFTEGFGATVHPVTFMQPNMALTDRTWVTGYRGHAVEFNGSSTYGSFPLLAEDTEQICIELMMQFGSNSAQTIIDQTSGLNLEYNGTGFVAAINGASNQSTQFTAWDPTLDTWYQITISYDGEYKYLWIDGNLYAKIASTGTISIPASTVYVGRTVAGAQYFDGIISSLSISRREIRPYKRVFSNFVLGTHGFDGKTEWVM